MSLDSKDAIGARKAAGSTGHPLRGLPSALALRAGVRLLLPSGARPEGGSDRRERRSPQGRAPRLASSRSKTGGMTLVELLVVLAILAGLTAAVMTGAAATREKGRYDQTTRDAAAMAEALARPDGLIEPLAEHHGLLGGMLEAAIKPAWPDDFRRIIDITYRFSAGWRRVHNPATGDDVADNLTTTEFATCMLAARGWSNAEIAAHMGISVNRVKECISKSLKKLGVSSRKELGRFLLS